jgi:Bacterial antitoxin of type II TA system, VapB
MPPTSKPKPKVRTAPSAPQGHRVSGGRKKTLRLDQELLDRARQALGARTETDAVTRALEAIVRREQQAQGVRALAALGPIDARRIAD